MEGIEPTTPRLQITCSGQLSYIGNVALFFKRSANILLFMKLPSFLWINFTKNVILSGCEKNYCSADADISINYGGKKPAWNALISPVSGNNSDNQTT